MTWTNKVRNRVAGSAANLRQLAEAQKHSADVLSKPTQDAGELKAALQQMVIVAGKIETDLQVIQAHRIEEAEALIDEVETLTDMSMLVDWGEWVKRLEPAYMAKALQEIPADKWRVAIKMIGPGDTDSLIEQMRKVWSDPKV